MSNNLWILPTPQTTSYHTMSTINSQSHSTALTVISANIEGLTAAKASMLSEMCKWEHCHCLSIQETHRALHLAMPKIPGMTLVNVTVVYVWEKDNVELISIEMSEVVVQPTKREVCTTNTRIRKTTLYILWMKKRLSSGQISATSSHWSTIQNYLCRSTVQDGREATTPTSSLYLRALLTCAENQAWAYPSHATSPDLCTCKPVSCGTSNTIQKTL